MSRLLITGFEPFGGELVNPSALAAERLAADGFAGWQTDRLVLPVIRYRAAELVIAAISRQMPDAVVLLGQAGGRGRITPERVAINVDDYRRPDNAGNQPVDEPIIADGPAAYFAHLPVKLMAERMRAAGAPAILSNTAGTYLCNHVAYAVLHHIATRGLPVRAGFIHVPYLPEQAARHEVETPSLSMETLTHGLRAGIEAALASLTPAPVAV